MGKEIKTGIMMHGGADRCAFAAGAVYELHRLGVQNVDLIMGASGSAPGACYFAANQLEELKKIWYEEAGTSEFADFTNFFRGKPIFNLKYLYGYILQQACPLSLPAIVDSPTKLLIPTFNLESEALATYSNRDSNFAADFWNILQASMALHNDQILTQPGEYSKRVDSDADPYLPYREGLFDDYDFVIDIHNYAIKDWSHKKSLGMLAFRVIQNDHLPGKIVNLLRHRKEIDATGLPLQRQFAKRQGVLLIEPDPSIRQLGLEGVKGPVTTSPEVLAAYFEAGAEAINQAGQTRLGLEVISQLVNRSKSLTK